MQKGIGEKDTEWADLFIGHGSEISPEFENIFSDVPAMPVTPNPSLRGNSLDHYWEVEGHRRIRRRPGEASGRVGSPAHLPETRRGTKRPGFKLLRPRRVSRKLPIGEEQEGGPEICDKRRKLHSGTSDTTRRELDENSMDCFEELGEGREDGGGDRDSGDEREVSEGFGPLPLSDFDEFERFNTDLRTSYRQRLDNLCQSFRLGQNQASGLEGTNQQGENDTGLQSLTPSIIRQPRRPASVVQLDQVQWNHPRRHGVHPMAAYESDPLDRHRNAPCPPRAVPNCQHTCGYGEDPDDELGGLGSTRGQRSGYCQACYRSTLVGV